MLSILSSHKPEQASKIRTFDSAAKNCCICSSITTRFSEEKQLVMIFYAKIWYLSKKIISTILCYKHTLEVFLCSKAWESLPIFVTGDFQNCQLQLASSYYITWHKVYQNRPSSYQRKITKLLQRHRDVLQRRHEHY